MQGNCKHFVSNISRTLRKKTSSINILARHLDWRSWSWSSNLQRFFTDRRTSSAEENSEVNSVSGDQNTGLNSNENLTSNEFTENLTSNEFTENLTSNEFTENLTSNEFTENPQYFEVSPITKPAEIYVPPILPLNPMSWIRLSILMLWP